MIYNRAPVGDIYIGFLFHERAINLWWAHWFMTATHNMYWYRLRHDQINSVVDCCTTKILRNDKSDVRSLLSICSGRILPSDAKLKRFVQTKIQIPNNPCAIAHNISTSQLPWIFHEEVKFVWILVRNVNIWFTFHFVEGFFNKEIHSRI